MCPVSEPTPGEAIPLQASAAIGMTVLALTIMGLSTKPNYAGGSSTKMLLLVPNRASGLNVATLAPLGKSDSAMVEVVFSEYLTGLTSAGSLVHQALSVLRGDPARRRQW